MPTYTEIVTAAELGPVPDANTLGEEPLGELGPLRDLLVARSPSVYRWLNTPNITEAPCRFPNNWIELSNPQGWIIKFGRIASIVPYKEIFTGVHIEVTWQ